MKHPWHILIRNLLGSGMTQAQIALAIGVTQGAISQVVNSGGRRGFGFMSGVSLLNLHSQRCGSIDIFDPHPEPRENTYPVSTNEQEATHG